MSIETAQLPRESIIGMMNRRTLVAIVFTLSALTYAAADNLRQIAKQHEAEFVKAMKSGDLAWFESVAAPDYHEISLKGKSMTRAEAMASMKQMFSMGKFTSVTSKVLSVKGTARAMVVTTQANMTAMMKFNPKASKITKMVAVIKYEESWSKTKGKWLMHSLKTLSDKTTADGKPFSSGT